MVEIERVDQCPSASETGPPVAWRARTADQGAQGRLGHASIQMTADRYGHLFPRGDDAAELAAAERAFMTVPGA
jgi:hypothetical protein